MIRFLKIARDVKQRNEKQGKMKYGDRASVNDVLSVALYLYLHEGIFKRFLEQSVAAELTVDHIDELIVEG